MREMKRHGELLRQDNPALCGLFPPNVMPEEILSSKPDRLRAVMCCQSNPLRSSC
jgi:hypothetical protein